MNCSCNDEKRCPNRARVEDLEAQVRHLTDLNKWFVKMIDRLEVPKFYNSATQAQQDQYNEMKRRRGL